MAQQIKVFDGMTFDADCTDELARIIVSLSRSQRVRVWLGHQSTGRSWNEENNVTGHLGRSTGTNPIPLLVHNSRSYGGGPLLTGCIVKMTDTRTGRVLWQHPNFSQDVFTFTASDLPEYEAGVSAGESQFHARFKTVKSAHRYVDFMNGKRACK